MTGGCGHDVCAPPQVAAQRAKEAWKPRQVTIGATVINANSAAAYRAAFLTAMLMRGQNNWYDKHYPLPTCTPGAVGAVNGACSVGEIDILTRFGDLVCQVGGFKCSHLSTRNYVMLGLAGFMPGMEGAGVGGGRGGARVRPAKRTNLGRCSSFVPGTSVLMADGTRKPIEDIKVGDKVLATDPETGESSAEPVLGTITSKGDKNLVRITIDTDSPLRFRVTGDEPEPSASELLGFRGVKSGVVIATDTHPFWVAGDINAWVEAADLEPGMWLRTSAGTYVQITATKTWTAHHQRVHNLTIANLHTYYVVDDAASILVHNCDGTIYWVKENASMGANARKYDSGAIGSRSGMAPALQYYKNGGNKLAQVKFDGYDARNGVMIDRKLAVTTFQKAYRQAQRQSLALEQNGMTGVWEVPNATQAARGRAILGQQMITNIRIRVVAR